MKKNILIILSMIFVLSLVVGCTQTSNSEDNKDMTEVNSTTNSTTKSTTVSTTESTTANSTESTTKSDDTFGILVAAGYIDITPQEAKELIDTTSNLVIVDVSPKYAQGHLPNAVNYYVGDGSLDTAIPTLDKSKVYLVYCHVDSAAIAGAEKLVEAGFDPVYRLIGNYAAWVDAGYPVE